ncbi:hypothetical protein BT96DRAFT_923601, partial [Gymnopus androsaceus JB14]
SLTLVLIPTAIVRFGATYIGNLVTAMYASICVQLYFYCTTYWNKDSWIIKTLVFVVCVLDTIHQVFSMLSSYSQLYSKHFMLEKDYLKKKIWLPAILELTVVAYLGVALCISWTDISVMLTKLKDLSTLGNTAISTAAISTFNDIAIALVFAYVLHQQKTGFQNTTTIINRIALYSLNTGICTAIFGIANIIATLTAGNTFLPELFFLIGSRLYANSLLAILNLRNKARIINSKNEFTSLGITGTPSAGEIHVFDFQTDQTAIPDQIALKNIVSLQDIPQTKNALGLPMSHNVKLNKHTPSATDYKTSFVLNTSRGYPQLDENIV